MSFIASSAANIGLILNLSSELMQVLDGLKQIAKDWVAPFIISHSMDDEPSTDPDAQSAVRTSHSIFNQLKNTLSQLLSAASADGDILAAYGHTPSGKAAPAFNRSKEGFNKRVKTFTVSLPNRSAFFKFVCSYCKQNSHNNRKHYFIKRFGLCICHHQE